VVGANRAEEAMDFILAAVVVVISLKAVASTAAIVARMGSAEVVSVPI
jgi:hypothetical protein